MRKIILLVLLVLPCMAFASTNCKLVEYKDHYEAICDGSAERANSSAQKTGQEQSADSGQTADSDIPDVPPEKIVRNGLARTHMASWLNTRHVH
jgi:hypothetical protein